MDWKDVGSTVAKVAPVLGAVLGGPIGAVAGAAGALVSSFLGVEPDPASVANAMQSPEALIKLKELEVQQHARLLDWQDAQLKAELENTKDARAMAIQLTQSGSKVGVGGPVVVSIIITVAFGYMCWDVLHMLKGEVSDAALMLLGTLATAFGAVVNYWLGSSLGSFQKNSR